MSEPDDTIELTAPISRTAVVSAPMTPMKPQRVSISGPADAPPEWWDEQAVRAARLDGTGLATRVKWED